MTLKKLTKYKNYNTFFLKNYADASKEAVSDPVQIPIQTDEINYLYKPNKAYFTCNAYTEPDDISVVDDIPAANQSKSNDKNSPSRAHRFLPDINDEFTSN